MKIIDSSNLAQVLTRSQLTDSKINESVKKIVEDVRLFGDKALFEYSLKFDNTDFNKESIKVTEQEFAAAYNQVDEKLLQSLRLSIENVLNYHKRGTKQPSSKSQNGKTTGYIIRAVQSAGIYVPGGTAAYPSSVVMGILPAVAAGVKKISVITPAKNGKVHPLTLVAAKECGADTVYKVGGAQGIAALAFGTESIEKVDIIAGPGNIYVALAKKEVYGHVGIDMIAGPSEILVICDKTANAAYVAADLLSQAEHDALSASYAVTDDENLAREIAAEVKRQLKLLPRADIAKAAIEKNGAVIVCESLEQAAEVSNKIAPEHLELMVEKPENLLDKITNAGAVFLGHYTPEPAGDYFAGPCHVLPTSGSARFFQVLNQDTFLKKISIISYSKDALLEDSQHIIRLAESEGLTAHANAVKIRLTEN